MISRRLVALGVVAAATVAACTTEQSSNPAPTLTSTTSTTSTTTTTTSTTTTLPPKPTTTVAQSTTSLPSGPADVEVPLLIGGAQGGWLSLGAWRFDAWAEAVDNAGDPVTPTIGPGTAVTVSNLGPDKRGKLGTYTDACGIDGRTGPTIDVTVPAPDPPSFGYGAVALPTPSWDLEPRPIAVLAKGPAAYEQLGADAFSRDPVDGTQGTVTQLVVTDLDGDGDDEAVVVYEHIQNSIRGAPGDFAAVLLVDATTRTSSTVLKSFVDRNLGANSLPLIERFRVVDVADYNGDGRMEVAVHSWYYEGASVTVFEYDGSELTQVLSTGCGA